MESTTEARVKRIVAEILGRPESEVRDPALLRQDLGANSLDVFELFMALEDEFAIVIPDDEAEMLRTVGEVVACVQRKAQVPA